MHCGGSVNVYFEPVNPNHKLFIFGAGHIGRTLAQFAKELSFQVIVIDDRQGIFNSEEFNGCKCIEMSYLKAVEQCNFDDDSYIVIVTPKHSFDEDILAVVARKPHKYIGMIGSNKKVKMAKERFISQNILTQEELDKINMPIGIKFAVETPEEIAISILAKLIDVRNSSKNC
ncbi:MAG: XdhC family protein [Bacteroidia bacterium]|nr:XdhC family protein [Bacteroidia bacterium]